MPINIGDNFSYLGKKFLDKRQSFETLEELMACKDVPEGFISYCVENETRYEFKNGEWIEFINEVDLTDYVTKEEMPTVTNDLTDELKSNYDDAYTHSQSTHAPIDAQKNSDITKVEIEAKLTGNIESHTHNQYLTEHQDLSDYALKSEIPTDYLTSIPEEYVTDTELNSKGYLTEQEASSNYALKSEIPTDYLTSIPSEYVTDEELNNKGYLTSIPSEYVTDEELNNSLALFEKVETSDTEPTEEDVAIWINTSDDTEGTPIARINDRTVASSTTWSSEKINALMITGGGNNGGGGGSIDLSSYALKSELHNHTNKTILDNITSNKISSWDNKSNFSGNYNDLTNKPTIPSLDGYATESYVNTAIDNAQLGGGDGSTVDMTKYALKTELPTKTSQLENDSNFITSIPNEYVTDEELNNKGYLTEHQDLSDYALKSEIPTNYLTSIPSEYITETELNNKGYATTSQIPTSLPANGGNANTVGGFTIWYGTQSQYDAIATKSNTTIYFIREG